MKLAKVLVFNIVLILSIPISAETDESSKELRIGVIETINSEILAEERVVNLYLPEGYSKSVDKRYPVIYLLDGSVNEDFLHVAGLVQFLTMYKLMPESILVGIANVDRKRDFTHSTNIQKLKQAVPTSGGSNRFIDFLKLELLPYIAKRYRTDESHKTIIGQSLGGLAASEILLKHSQTFDQFIIVSPSLWWDDQSLINSSSRPKLQSRQKFVLAIGEEGDEMQEVFDKLVTKLRASVHPDSRWTQFKLPKETHATVLHRSLYQAFEFLYEDEYPGL